MNTQYETADVNPELWKAIPASDKHRAICELQRMGKMKMKHR